jgi:hypothetical protein
MLQQYFSRQTKNFSRLSFLLSVIVIAGIGTYILTASHAAGPYAAVNASAGSLAGAATLQTDSTASNGKSIKFGSVATGGGSVLWKGDGSAPIDQQWASVSDQTNCGVTTSPGMFPDSRISLENTGVAATSAQGRAIHFFYAATDYPGCFTGRSELSQGNPTKSGEPAGQLLNPGNDEWFAWEAYFPSDYPLTPVWNQHGSPWGGGMVQWHQAGGCNAPPFNMGVKGGASAGNLFVFYNDSPNDCPVTGQQVEKDGGASWPINHNQWYKFEVHANFETSHTGSFQVYVDLNDGQGIKLFFSSPQMYTLYANALPGHARIGILDDSSWAAANDQDLYVAGYTATTTQAAAEANAFGAQGP